MLGWQAGLPVTEVVPKFDTTDFTPNLNSSMLASYEEVKAISKTGNAILIDSRARDRYLVLVEPLDPRPGHIPRAINKEWTDSFVSDKWKSKQAQQERFTHLDQTEEIIVYCSSGVTATPNIIALLDAGFTNVKLYAGSYSDWVSYPENEGTR